MWEAAAVGQTLQESIANFTNKVVFRQLALESGKLEEEQIAPSFFCRSVHSNLKLPFLRGCRATAGAHKIQSWIRYGILLQHTPAVTDMGTEFLLMSHN